MAAPLPLPPPGHAVAPDARHLGDAAAWGPPLGVGDDANQRQEGRTSPLDDEALLSVARRNLAAADLDDGDETNAASGSRLSLSWTHGRGKDADATASSFSAAAAAAAAVPPPLARSFGAVERTLSLSFGTSITETAPEPLDVALSPTRKRTTAAPSLVLYSGMPATAVDDGGANPALDARRPHSLEQSCASAINLKEALRLARSAPPKPPAPPPPQTTTTRSTDAPATEDEVFEELEQQLEALRRRRGATAATTAAPNNNLEDFSVLGSLLKSEGIELSDAAAAPPAAQTRRSAGAQTRRRGRGKPRQHDPAPKELYTWEATKPPSGPAQ